MNNKVLTALVPLTLLLSACTPVKPAYQDIGSRLSPCVDGGPDSVAQTFYNLRTENPSQGIPDSALLAQYRPWLSDKLYHSLQKASQDTQQHTLQGDLFSSMAAGPGAAEVMSASSIPNTDARNIPLRVSMRREGNKPAVWKDEVLMVREGRCWTIDDVRYLAAAPHLSGGSLRQALEK